MDRRPSWSVLGFRIAGERHVLHRVHELGDGGHGLGHTEPYNQRKLGKPQILRFGTL